LSLLLAGGVGIAVATILPAARAEDTGLAPTQSDATEFDSSEFDSTLTGGGDEETRTVEAQIGEPSEEGVVTDEAAGVAAPLPASNLPGETAIREALTVDAEARQTAGVVAEIPPAGSPDPDRAVTPADPAADAKAAAERKFALIAEIVKAAAKRQIAVSEFIATTQVSRDKAEAVVAWKADMSDLLQPNVEAARTEADGARQVARQHPAAEPSPAPPKQATMP